MDDLKLPTVLFLIWDVKRAIETQKSLQIGLQNFNKRALKDAFTVKFQSIIDSTPNEAQKLLQDSKMTIYQKNLVTLITQGVAGHGIYQALVRLEKELLTICEDDVEKHTQLLPLTLQIPLLGLIFPALMMILLIPVINMLSL